MHKENLGTWQAIGGRARKSRRPHYIVLSFLGLAACACIIILARFAIVFTGRYPRPLFDFIVGVFRWWLRVAAYAFLLTTDRYPPFSLFA